MHDREHLTTPPPENNVSSWDYLLLLAKWKKMILINVVIVTLLAAGISMILPKWYRATASIMPPKDASGTSLMGSATSALKSLGGGVSKLGGLASQSKGAYNYLAIFRSRTAMEDVIKKFDLINVYDVPDQSMELAIKELTANTNFEVQDDDNITVDVLDTDPQRAADIANRFVELLNMISVRLGTQEARNNREFIEQRVGDIRHELREAEDSLKLFQESSPLLMSPDQSGTGSTSGIGELYALKMKREIEVSMLERNFTPDNQILQQAKAELNELTKKLSHVPQAGIGALRTYRQVAIQQKVLEYIYPLYEQAKIDEQKDIPVILVLDKAVKAEKKVKPKRLTIIVTAFGASLALSLLFVFAVAYVDVLKKNHPEKYAQVKKNFT